MKIKIIPLLLCSVMLLSFSPSALLESTHNNEGIMTFRFFDVPEIVTKIGDCSFIQFPNGETMLIDAFIANAAPYVVEDLKALGVTRIDYLVVSHYHGDHIGGMPAFMDNFEIGGVYTSGLHVYTTSGLNLLSKMEEMGLEEHILRQGDVLQVGDVDIQILNPDVTDEVMAAFESGEVPSDAAVNVQSLVMKFIYKDFTALFTGDVYDKAERWLMDKYGDELHVMLFKAPHHGSYTSSGARFLRTINPQYVVAIGNVGVVGGKNKYMRIGAEAVYYTYMDGTVVATTDGKTVTFEANKEAKQQP